MLARTLISPRSARLPTASCSSSSSSARRSASTSSSDSPTSTPAPPTLRTQLLIHRRPYLTPPQPAFLEATHAYTARLSRALAAELPHNIYFKKGSLAARRFAHEESLADKAAFGIEPESEVEAVEKDSATTEVLPRADRADERYPASSEGGVAEAVESAERKGERSVYLCVSDKQGRWRFPGAGQGFDVPAEPTESEDARGLAARAQSATHALLGPNLSLWPVGRHPIAFLPSPPPSSPSSPSSASSTPTPPDALTFIFKSHLLAGSPVLSAVAKQHGWTAFGYLTKEELGARVGEEPGEEGKAWWAVVEGLLNDY